MRGPSLPLERYSVLRRTAPFPPTAGAALRSRPVWPHRTRSRGTAWGESSGSAVSMALERQLSQRSMQARRRPQHRLGLSTGCRFALRATVRPASSSRRAEMPPRSRRASGLSDPIEQSMPAPFPPARCFRNCTEFRSRCLERSCRLRSVSAVRVTWPCGQPMAAFLPRSVSLR